MVKKVLEKRPTKAITVYVDMKDVDRVAKKVCASVSQVTEYVTRISYYYRKIHLGTQRMKAMMRSNLMM